MSTEPRTICIPVDGSENSNRAFQFYLDVLRSANDKLVVVHILESPSLPSMTLTSGITLPAAEWMTKIQAQLKVSEKLCQDYEYKCLQARLPCQVVTLSNRKPGEGILDAIEGRSVDMIVIGSRGISKLRKTLLGSVSDYLVHNSEVPVTIVPPKC